MSETTIGAILFEDIERNEYLNELYDAILQNYGRQLFGFDEIEENEIDVRAALRFADLLSKSVHGQNKEKHRQWAQEIVSLLKALYPDDEVIQYYLGSVLTSISNFRGVDLEAKDYISADTMDRVYTQMNKAYLRAPGEKNEYFFQAQKEIYERFNGTHLSYSAPASLDESFAIRMFIREQIRREQRCNFVRVVSAKANIDRVQKETISDLDRLPGKQNYSIATRENEISAKGRHNYILIMTPERLLYTLINNPGLKLDYVFIEDAQEFTGSGGRGAYYYKIIDLLAQQTPTMPHFMFASPRIANPEVYLELVTEVEKGSSYVFSSDGAPVTQFKFLINLENRLVRFFNDHTKDTLIIGEFKNGERLSVVDILNTATGFGGKESFRERNIVYFGNKKAAVNAAREYASDKSETEDPELLSLSRDIQKQVHEDYFLVDLIKKGVAYHTGYLPASIRQRMENLFETGQITTMFCAGSVDDMSCSADNLFIIDYNSRSGPMTSAEFHNMIGRAGQIDSGLYGNVFLVSDGDQVKEEDWIQFLKDDAPEQRLSIVQDLKPELKRHVVNTLMEGQSDIEPYVTGDQKQTEEEYAMMSRFGSVLLKDIMDDRNSVVRREFSEQMSSGDEEIIRECFAGKKNFADVDINVSPDQTKRLEKAICQGMHYPEVTSGRFAFEDVLKFLEQLCQIFDWDKYEPETLGKRNKSNEHTRLRQYAVVLSQWMEDKGLNDILCGAIEYREKLSGSFWLDDKTPLRFDGSLEHINIVLDDMLDIIENVILSSISSYFLRFSNMYISIKGKHSLDYNDWYEIIESRTDIRG